MVIVRRAIFWVAVVAVAVVWATSHLNQTRHYSDTPGQGAALQRTELPPLDTSKGGPVPLPPSGSSAAAHIPAHPAGVEPPIAAPPPVTDRSPAATPQDPQLKPQPGNGGAGSGSTSSASLLPQLPISLNLPTCDAACLQRVLAGLASNLPVPLPPVTVPPVTVPSVGGTSTP